MASKGYSSLIRLSLLVFLLAGTFSNRCVAEEGGAFHPTAQLLIARHGLFHDAKLQQLIDTVFDRVASGASFSDYTYPIVINSSYPLALSFRDGTVILSRGLIRSLNSESELAFVFAHEIGHVKLKHFYRHKLEIRDEYMADEFAIKYLIAAGYSPDAALRAIKHSHTSIEQLSNNSTHPLASERIFYARKVIASSYLLNLHPSDNHRRFLAIIQAAGV